MNDVSSITQTIILAAGLGSRLRSAEAGVPKPLLMVGGRPLIAHALAHAEASGCNEAVVVVGYESRRVEAAVRRLRTALLVRFVEADSTSPNGHSLLAAEPLAQPRFLLQMVDHVFGAPVLNKLAAELWRHGESGRLLVDPSPIGLDLDDATRVQLKGVQITGIGKHLWPWDAIDTGCFALTRDVFAAFDRVPAAQPRTVSSAMRQLARAGALYAVAIDGVPWVDVDTPADLPSAERVVAGASLDFPSARDAARL